MPQVFRRAPPRADRRVLKHPETTAHERGYTTKWTTYSKAYRKKHPFCVVCEENGRMTLVVANRTGVVDHKWPVADGGPFWDKANHWSLCEGHHNGWKRRLEEHARRTGQVDQLIRWCDDPSSRPKLRGDV